MYRNKSIYVGNSSHVVYIDTWSNWTKIEITGSKYAPYWNVCMPQRYSLGVSTQSSRDSSRGEYVVLCTVCYK